MNILQRLFKIGQSEAHSAVNQLEDPIKLTEQGLRDLRQDLDKALHGELNRVFELVDGGVGFRLPDFEETLQDVHGTRND